MASATGAVARDDQGATGGALGTYGNRCTPPLDRQERRASRHRLKVAQRFATASKSSALCLFSILGQVSVGVGRQVTAHVAGIARCGSPWACPVCAPVVRERRALEIDTATRAHLDAGGGVEFLTVTCRHHLRDALAPRLDVISTALRHVLTGAPWQRRRQALGYIGAIRAVEVTDGANGWHPHCHALLFFERPLTDGERADLRSWVFGRWSGVVARHGFGTVTEANGVDLRPVTAHDGIGSYLSKVEGGWGAGLELARTDIKRGAPTQHLADFAMTGDVRSLRRWQEYEAATRGKRAIVWSPGLRARLLGSDEEAADEDLAASEGLDLVLLEALLDAGDWNRQVRAGATAEVLSSVEEVAAVLFVLADLLGHDLQPLHAPGGGP